MSLVDRMKVVIDQRYPDYANYPNGERVLLAMSVLANDLHVHEVGDNRGPDVKEILSHVGLGEGYKWCAASIEFCCDYANMPLGPSDRASAAVVNWMDWGRQAGRTRSKAARGRLCAVHTSGISHIGIVAGIQEDGRIISYEGNTSSGLGGSQSDGGGLYCRLRRPSFWQTYIELDEPAD